MTPARERIDVLLVERNLAPSRERARALVLAGEVLVNDHRVEKAGDRVPVDAAIRLKNPPDKYVSRGAHKLVGALDAFGASPAGRVALDVGASTGGFTQVLLERGAVLVHALDVGHNQLAWSIRQDPRVKVYEGVNFRTYDPAALAPRPVFATVDVSFIGLKHILPVLAAALPAGGEAVVLVKPQFELGPEHVGKGGVVRDDALRRRALDQAAAAAAAAGFEVRATADSALPGAEGNREYFMHLFRKVPA
jgi:23S rRNA (cytidine1920-2'-O)/16S rRNA (cytidine1409-2'-O)-methyltransferase